jgi:hypothetical protein
MGIIFRHLLGETEETHEKPQSGNRNAWAETRLLHLAQPGRSVGRSGTRQHSQSWFPRLLNILIWGLLLDDRRGLTTTAYSLLYWGWLEQVLTL